MLGRFLAPAAARPESATVEALADLRNDRRVMILTIILRRAPAIEDNRWIKLVSHEHEHEKEKPLSEFLFAPPAPVSLTVAGQSARFPIHRIFCVGRTTRRMRTRWASRPAARRRFVSTKPR